MSIVYDIFAGDSSGGPVDYSSAVTSTASLSMALPALSTSTTTRFGVRARDTGTGLSDSNTDAQVMITVGSTGADLTSVPRAPQALSATAGAGGTATVRWSYPYPGTARRPTGFHVYRWLASGSPDYSTVLATVSVASVRPGTTSYRASLSGLTGGTAYSVAVRAYNAAGEESNTTVVTVTGQTTAPANVTDLTAVATT